MFEEELYQRKTHSSGWYSNKGRQLFSTGVKVSPQEFKELSYNSRNMVIEGDQGTSSQYMNKDWSVGTDHCYARPWNWRPESNFLRPTKTLFVPKQNAVKQKSNNRLALTEECDDFVDIETVPDLPTSIYDIAKSKQLMEECERHAALARVYDDENCEDKISKTNWTATQTRLFKGVMEILNSDHLARSAYSGVNTEAIMRRTIIDKSVQRLRRLLSTVAWDTKLIQWLHLLLIDNLNKSHLSAYLDILQTLRSKLPSFTEKMLYSPTASNRLGVLRNESLFPLLKRVWDPVASSLLQDKPKKLPTSPIILVVPSTFTLPKRSHKWISLLSNLATVITVPVTLGTSAYRMTTVSGLDQMYATTRAKLQEIRADQPGRNIVLLGFNAGATLALQIAQVEQVLCVICVGFSLLTADGTRGDPEDNLLELQTPVLFIIGQNSNTSSQEEMEDLRERMRVETGLIVVGAADDYLRITKKKKRQEGITQSVVDRCIVDEVGEFISGIILSPFPPQIRQSPSPSEIKKPKTERRRFNSNTSSIDSEPPSPTPRISRPGQANYDPILGRPPGSKSKPKPEPKFTQGTSSIPTSPRTTPPPTPFIPVTQDTNTLTDSPLTEKSSDSTVKKIKTLKPVINLSPEKVTKSPTPNTSPSKISSQGLSYTNRPGIQSTFASTFIQQQAGIKTIPPMTTKSSVASSIKVLENVTLTSGTKFVSNFGRSIDLSKITLVNSLPTKSTGLGNVLLLPDGKIKAVSSSSVKGNKFITSKKQLLGHKPPKMMKKISYVSHPSIQTNLPPPTNLTTQDIMDLPIIFADDNQIIEPSSIQADMLPSLQPVQPPQPQPAKIITSAGNKFVVLNKQVTSQPAGNYIITPTTVRKMAPVATIKNQKYTKIILSKRDESKSSASVMSHISNLSPEISIRKILPEKPSVSSPASQSVITSEPIDLETEIVATAVPKPNLGNTSILKKTLDSSKSDLQMRSLEQSMDNSSKRTAAEAEMSETETDIKYFKLSLE